MILPKLEASTASLGPVGIPAALTHDQRVSGGCAHSLHSNVIVLKSVSKKVSQKVLKMAQKRVSGTFQCRLWLLFRSALSSLHKIAQLRLSQKNIDTMPSHPKFFQSEHDEAEWSDFSHILRGAF